MKYNPQKINFNEALKQVRAEYLKFKKELEVLKQRLQEAIDKKTARLASFELEPTESVPTSESKENLEAGPELLAEASRDITSFEAETDQLIQKAEQENQSEIANEAIRLKKKFRNRMAKFVGVLLLAFAQQASEIRIPTESFTEKDQAKAELKTKGITSYQGRRYIPGVSELLFRGIRPIGYGQESKINNFIPNLIHDDGASGWEEGYSHMSEKEYTGLHRIDAWRLYLGLPQKHNTFGISDYKPAKSTEEKYYFKINNFIEANTMTGTAVGMKPIETLLSHINSEKAQKIVSEDINFIMGNYTLSKGRDEKGYYISYYDRWDLDPTIEGKEGFIGQPFEIYDRIYYNPDNFEIIEPK